MGYFCYIHEHSLTVTADENEIQKVIKNFRKFSIYVEDGYIMFSESEFKWDDEVYHDLALLSDVSEGYIVIYDEYGTYQKFELKDGKIIKYTAEIVFHKEDEYSTKNIVEFLKKNCYRDEDVIILYLPPDYSDNKHPYEGYYLVDLKCLKVYKVSFSTLLHYLGGRISLTEVLKSVSPLKKIPRRLLEKLVSMGLKKIAFMLAL